MILYGKPGCPWALRARFALAEAGVAFDFVTPDDARWDPTLTVTPVLERPEGRLPESAEIVRWALAARGGTDTAPAPGSPAARLQVAVATARTVADVPPILAAVAGAVPPEGWIDGDEPGPRDVEAWMALASAARYGAPLPPAAAAYWARARARPSVRQVLGA